MVWKHGIRSPLVKGSELLWLCTMDWNIFWRSIFFSQCTCNFTRFLWSKNCMIVQKSRETAVIRLSVNFEYWKLNFTLHLLWFFFNCSKLRMQISYLTEDFFGPIGNLYLTFDQNAKDIRLILQKMISTHCHWPAKPIE